MVIQLWKMRKDSSLSKKRFWHWKWVEGRGFDQFPVKLCIIDKTQVESAPGDFWGWLFSQCTRGRKKKIQANEQHLAAATVKKTALVVFKKQSNVGVPKTCILWFKQQSNWHNSDHVNVKYYRKHVLHQCHTVIMAPCGHQTVSDPLWVFRPLTADGL